MQDFKQLKVYQESYALSIDICREIKNNHHQRNREQLMASASSVPANLCEFAGMESTPQKKEKLRTCIREANETEHWLNHFKDIGELSEDKFKDYSARLISVRKMLINLLKAVESKATTK